MSSYVTGVSRADAGRNGWETPESTACTSAPERRPAADLVDHRPQRRPERHLADTGAQRRSGDGADDRARGRGGAELTEPRRAVGQDERDVGQRLDVVGQRRWGLGRRRWTSSSSMPRTYGGATRGNGGRPSVTSRSAVSSPNRYSPGPATMSSSMPSAQPASRTLGDGGPQPGDLLGERPLDGHDDAVGADRVGGDQARPRAPDTGCGPAASGP